MLENISVWLGFLSLALGILSVILAVHFSKCVPRRNFQRKVKILADDYEDLIKAFDETKDEVEKCIESMKVMGLYAKNIFNIKEIVEKYERSKWEGILQLANILQAKITKIALIESQKISVMHMRLEILSIENSNYNLKIEGEAVIELSKRMTEYRLLLNEIILSSNKLMMANLLRFHMYDTHLDKGNEKTNLEISLLENSMMIIVRAKALFDYSEKMKNNN